MFAADFLGLFSQHSPGSFPALGFLIHSLKICSASASVSVWIRCSKFFGSEIMFLEMRRFVVDVNVKVLPRAHTCSEFKVSVCPVH